MLTKETSSEKLIPCSMF